MIECPFKCGEYREDIGLLVCRPTGQLTADDLADITICRDCIERAGLNQVDRFHDLTGITSVDLNFDDVFQLAFREKVIRNPEQPVKACYLVANELVYGTVRMYQAVIESRGVEVHIAYEIGPLAEVLGVEADELVPTRASHI